MAGESVPDCGLLMVYEKIVRVRLSFGPSGVMRTISELSIR